MKLMKAFGAAMAVVVALGLLACGDAGSEEGQKVSEAAINGAIQDGRYAEALSLLDGRISAKEEREYSLYLKGLVLYYQEDNDGCVQTLSQLLKEYPKGKWALKARFRQAAAHLAEKQYAQAERIFEEEAERLMSGERKDRIASVYTKFAEESMSPPDKLVKPDYDKAYRLLKKSLELQVGTGMRDDVSFKAARCMELSGKWNEAVKEYQSYLAEFEKDGKHKDEARYNLGWCHLKAGQPMESRRVWRDLMQGFEKAEKDALSEQQRSFWAKASFNLAKTYGLPNPGNTHYLDLGVTALEDFLKRFPEDEDAPQAAIDIAQSQRNGGRDAEALESFKAFLDGKGYKVVGDKARETHEKLRMEATYLMGEISRRQKNYAAAIATWGDYVRQFPNGPHWSGAQEGILEAEYAKGADLLEEEKYDEARAAFEAFLARHPLDVRFARIMYTIGRSYFDQEKWDEAIAEWRKLVSKFPNGEEASHGQFMIGQVFEEKKKELEAAIDEYKKVTWGNWKPQAEQRIAEMQRKELTVVTERTFRGSEKAKVKVQLRNIETLTVKAYRIDLVDYFRKMHLIRGVEDLDIGLIDPDKVWEVKVEEYAKYKPIEQEIDLPFDEPGAYALNISDEKTYEATTLVLKSDLDVIIKSSRKSVFVFAENMAEKKPFAGVKVHVSDGSKVLCEGETDGDGVFKRDLEELKSLNDLRVLAVKEGHFASNLVGLSGLGFSRGLSPKGYIYSDRPAYRPGQKVSIKGILRTVKDDAYSFKKGEEYVLDVVDSQGRILKSEVISLSEFGSFYSEFDLDRFAPVGNYQLLVHPPQGKEGTTFTGAFLVQEYKLEKVKLNLEFERNVYFRGETVEGKISAMYYYGEPVVGKKVEYWLPDGRHLSDTTDKDGTVRFEMETREFPEERALQFTAALPDENVRASETVFLAVRGFTASVSTIRGVYLSEEKFDVTVGTKDLEGEPLSAKMELIVLRREATGKRWSEVEVSRHALVTDAKSGEGRVNVGLAKGGPHILRASGRDRFGNRIVSEAGVFISDKEDKTKVRIITDRQHFKVGEEVSVMVHSRLDENLALLTFEGEGILSYRLVTLKEGANPVETLIGHDHFPNFALGVAVMDGNKFYTASIGFSVERELKVSVKPSRETLEPGAELEVEIQTFDQNGKPVGAELSLAMVDEALFSIFADPLAEISAFFREGQQREAAMRTESSCTFSYAARTVGISAEVVAEMERMNALQDELTARGQALERGGEIVKFEVAGEDGRRRGPQGGIMAGAVEVMADELEATAPVITDLLHGDLILDGKEELRRGYRYAGARVARKAAPEAVLPAEPRLYFPEVGYWNPNIVTDAEGKARLTFKVPDTATQWRLTLRGVTPETLAGQCTANVVTRKEFFVELKVPSILMEGDRPRMVARVHNLTDFEGDANLKLRTTVDGETNTTPKTLKISKGVTEALFDAVEVPAAKEIVFELIAEAGERADAVSQTVPVRPWGLVYRGGSSGTASGDETLWTGLPSGRKYTNLEMSIFVGTTLQRALTGIALDGDGSILRERAFRSSIVPPDTTSGSASSLIGVLSCLEYTGTSVDAGGPDVRRLRQKAESHISELAVSQRDDGGWSWAGRGAESDAKASAMALWALGRARTMGFVVPDKTLAAATGYLQKAFASARQTDNEGKAVILHALGFVDKADFTFANRLYRERSTLSEAALAYVTLTLDALDRPAVANEVLDVLVAKAKPVPVQSRQALKWSGAGNQAWIRNDIETTALTLLAIAKVRPDAPQLKQGIEWLMSQRQASGWLPYRAKGPALAAVCTYYGKAAKVTNDYVLRITVNDTEVKTVRVEKSGDTVPVAVPASLLKPEGNKVNFDMEGMGEYSYVIAMTGFSAEMKHERYERFYVDNRFYMPPAPEYKGRAVQTGFSVCRTYRFFRNLVTQVGQGSVTQVQVELERRYDDRKPEEDDYLILEESIPSGTTVLENSITGNFNTYTLGDGKITFYFGSRPHVGNVLYQLYGYLPGEYRVLPSVLRSAYDPTQSRVGPEAKITVLAAGEKSTDPYRPTPDELYYLGKAYVDDGEMASAAPLLAQLYNEKEWEMRDEFLKETARMLLEAAIESGEPKEIVKYFEVLKEKYPELFMPFDKILAVGRAYRAIEEYERAYLVFKATAEAGFVKDANVAGTLQAEGKFLPSIEYMTDLWLEYPDVPSTESTYFALSQAVYAKASEVLTDDELKKANLTKAEMIGKAIDRLNRFLTLYPVNPANDDASFSLVNAFLELEGYDEVVKLSQRFQQKFPESEFFDSFVYTEAIARFSLGEYDRAIELCGKVAEMKLKDASGVERESKNKWLALYMIGQIYHAQGKPKEAIESYQKVEQQFPDAKEAIDYFEHKALSFEDVSTFLPDEKPEIELTYRNIAEIDVKAYKVDLMKLFLQEKNLSRITSIRLAGIAPTHEETVQLGEGKDYEDKKRKIALPVKEEGAYLILARGENLHASGFVLVSPLKMNVQEDAVSGRVRVNLVDRVSGAYVNKADVKVIGSESGAFVSGETDLRGVFIADGIQGMAATIARDEDRRYAFHRGTAFLARAEESKRRRGGAVPLSIGQAEWGGNLILSNSAIQGANIKQLDEFYRQQPEGVQVQQAK